MITGRAQRFGSDINTDYIIAAQHKAASLDVSEMARHTFEDIDPDFVDRVRPGDVVVADANFGCGSSRETAPRVLLACGISAVLAPSFGRIFFRNAINVGLPVIECDTSGVEQDDVVEIDLEHHQAGIGGRDPRGQVGVLVAVGVDRVEQVVARQRIGPVVETLRELPLHR